MFIRFLPFFAAFLAWVGLEFIIIKPRLLWLVGVTIIILVVITTFLLAQRRLDKNFWRFLLSPFLFVVSSLLFLSFLITSSAIARQVIILVIVINLWLVLAGIFKYFQNQAMGASFINYSLENYFRYSNILTIFLFFVVMYSVNIFFNPSPWILLMVVFWAVLALSYQQYWLAEVFRQDDCPGTVKVLQQELSQLIVDRKLRFRIYLLVPALILLEIFWAVSFLPTSFYVNGFLVTVIYYGMMNIIWAKIQNNLNKKLIKESLFVVSISLMIILFTARW